MCQQTGTATGCSRLNPGYTTSTSMADEMELYFDCNATTPVLPEVVEAMSACWRDNFGNPSSSHRVGRKAGSAIEQARRQVADLVAADSRGVIFTGGGTEANHLAILGLAAEYRQPGTIAVGITEHDSLHGAVKILMEQGWKVLELAVDGAGKLVAETEKQLAQAQPQLISVMVANNETGVIQDLEPLQRYVENHSATLHLDATQAAGKIALDFAQLRADAITLSAHKIYGPKGVGALVLGPNQALKPLLLGGGQERGLRSGTENVPAIVGFGKAAELAALGLQERADYLCRCRNHLEQGLQQVPGIEVVAQKAERLPNTVMCLSAAMEGETLLMQLDQHGVALSSGSACKAGKTEPNRVLLAMGVSAERARNSIRISLCQHTTVAHIDRFLQILTQVLTPPATAWSAVG